MLIGLVIGLSTGIFFTMLIYLRREHLKQRREKQEFQKCPTCKGKGKVPYGFYNFSPGRNPLYNDSEKCQTCNGKGILLFKFEVKKYNIMNKQVAE